MRPASKLELLERALDLFREYTRLSAAGGEEALNEALSDLVDAIKEHQANLCEVRNEDRVLVMVIEEALK